MIMMTRSRILAPLVAGGLGVLASACGETASSPQGDRVSDAVVDAGADTEADGGGGADASGDTVPDADVGGDAGAGTDAGADADVSGDAGAGADASADAVPDAEVVSDAGADPDADVADEWTLPDCDSIVGTGAITIATDEGASVLPRSESWTGFRYTHGVVALHAPNTFLAHADGSVLRSEDSGCTWTEIGTTVEPVLQLTADGDRAYAWQDNGAAFYRIEGDIITPLESPTENIIGLGTDPAIPGHVRIGNLTADIYASDDMGDHMVLLSTGPGVGSQGYRVTFDPNDVDHILYGRATTGAWHTVDGGEIWTQATGLSTDAGGRANIFSLVVSLVDRNIVWAEGIDLGSDETYIFRSEDGGLTFFQGPQETTDYVMTNGTLMAAHPRNTDVVYWTWGTCFSGHGADMYRYDHSTGLSQTNQPEIDSYGSIAFHPLDPSVMLLGLDTEDWEQCL